MFKNDKVMKGELRNRQLYCMFLSRDMIRTYSQVHRADSYSQHRSIVWLNGLVFVYERSGCSFESSCSHLNFRYRACFEQKVP